MKLVDTDVFTLVLAGNPSYSDRYDAVEPNSRSIAVVTAEEILRGRLASIRAAQSKSDPNALAFAYKMLRASIIELRKVAILNYTPAAHQHYLRLKSHKIRIGTRDLRIASIALAHDATLITRNRRDFDLVPSLQLEVWN